MVLMAPADEPELRAALEFGLSLDQPCAIRYPRDNVPPAIPQCPPFVLGQSRRIRAGDDATILCYGVTTVYAMAAADILAENGIDAAVVNARFAKPIDREMVEAAFRFNVPVVTVEDHSVAGGFGSAVLETVQELGLSAARMARLGLPADRFIAHGSRAGQLAECGIDATGIAATVQTLVEAGAPAKAWPRTCP